jgi:hypothetical protein
MNSSLECGVTASFLRSAKMLANASHCAALIGAAGVLLASSLPARLIFAASVLCWPGACYLGLRCAVDAYLFRDLPLAEEGAGKAMDSVLRAHGLIRNASDRPLADRCRGALALWKRMVALVSLQVLAVLAGVIVQALAR